MTADTHTETKKDVCFLCKKKFSLDMLYYCFCDTTVCQKCIPKLISKEDYWACPNCKTELKIAESKLIRVS